MTPATEVFKSTEKLSLFSTAVSSMILMSVHIVISAVSGMNTKFVVVELKSLLGDATPEKK